MSINAPDPASIAGKSLDVAERTQVLVIGGGPSGLAAAREAVLQGLSVVLVDENPISAETIGEDLPLLYGQRASGVVRNRNAMMDVMASNPAIIDAYDAGVDVRLGTTAWGLYANGPSVGWLPGIVAGLADGERSWLIGCDQVIVATGRRDMGLAFPGWELPGVMGAAAAHRLASFDALDVRRAIVLGTTADALSLVELLISRGIEVAAVVEQSNAPVGPVELVASVAARGVPILCRHVVERADGGIDGIERVIVANVYDKGRHAPGGKRAIACDTVILGIGAVPCIELFDAIGCEIAFRPERGGFVPVLGTSQRCSVPGIFAVGDCSGIWPQKTAAQGDAEEEGRTASRSAAAAIVGKAEQPHETSPIPQPTFDMAAYRLAWVKASVVEASGEPNVCRCEEVTAREILEVRQPRYLGPETSGRNDRSLRAMLGRHPPHPDQVKRLTRAGMGLCQGRRCREQIQALLALEAGTSLAAIPLAGYRAPVRPLSLRLAGQNSESVAMAENWDTWFGMASQYAIPSECGGPYTVAGRKLDEKVASE